jgi:hypothetical protein
MMAKEPEDILNPCGYRNSERIEALKKLPSSVCPACLLERIKDLEIAKTIGIQACDLLKEQIEELEAENLNRPHLIPTNCPTYYDGCHCTVKTLIHNIKRADEAKARIKELERQIKAYESRPASATCPKCGTIIKTV